MNPHTGEESSSRGGPTGGSAWRRRFIVARWVLLALFFLSLALVVTFRFVGPPFTAFMAADFLWRLVSPDNGVWIHYQWADWEDISPNMGLAVIAAEDQKFPYHHGFDLESIQDAIQAGKRGKRLRGASTISQQVAKNLFLWKGRSFLRKGLEAYFALLIESFWPKKRILEVYLNIAEFGDGVYGVSEASRLFFRKAPAKLTKSQAALLASVLPNPKRFRVKRPSGYIFYRRNWISRQMSQLGGTTYLDEL